MSLACYSFRPHLLPTLAVLALLPVLIGLGLWQLDRAEQKRALAALYTQRLEAPALSLNRPIADADQMLYRRAEVSGFYDPAYTILVDNRVLRGRVGFDVVSLLRIGGTARYVLVNRGWIPLGPSRNDLPDVPTPAEEVRLTGVLVRPAQQALVLGDVDTRLSGGTQIVQYLDLDAIGESTGYDVMPLVLRQDGDHDPQLDQSWQPLAMPPERNVGYAIQWFGLAIALAVLFLVVSFKRK